MADSTKTQGTDSQPQHATEELRPERLGAELRPERLGSQLRPERLGEPLKAERIQGMLAELPGWTAAKDGQALTRTYLFPTIRASVAFVALAAEIGEANGYVPDIDLRHLLGRGGVDRRLPQPPEAPSADALAFTDRALRLFLDQAEWHPFAWHLVDAVACLQDAASLDRLLADDADLDDADPRPLGVDSGRTVLHRAVVEGRAACVARLLAAGASPDAPMADGRTPLMLAARDPRRADLVAPLLAAGADPSRALPTGHTALHLLAATPSPSDEILAAARLAVADRLLAAGADPDAATADGDTPLLLGAHHADLDLVEHLLDGGATLTEATWRQMANAVRGPQGRARLEHLWRDRRLPVPSLVELFPQPDDPDPDTRASRETRAAIRDLGTALMSWLTDQVSAASTRAPDLADLPVVSSEQLQEMLVPLYLSWVPTTDGWGHRLEVRLATDLLAGSPVIAIRSPGRDGRFDDAPYEPGSFPAAEPDHDLVWVDGAWMRWPDDADRR